MSLADTPLLMKRDLVQTLPKVWLPEGTELRAALAAGEIEIVETPGTAGARARVVWKKGALRAAEDRVLASLAANPAGTSSSDRANNIAVLGPPTRGMGSCHSGDPTYDDRIEGDRLHLNSRQDPFFWTDLVMGRMLEEIERQQTNVIVADPVYATELALFANARGATLPVRDAFVFTGSLAAASHEHAVKKVTNVPISEYYGTVETGPLLVKRAGLAASNEDAPWIPANDDVYLEYLPIPGAVPSVCRGAEAGRICVVVATTLTRAVTPLARFATMDLVELDASGAPIAMHGRAADVIVHPNGTWITARAIERAFRAIGEDALVQVSQRSADALDVDVVRGDIARADIVAKELFDGMRVSLAPKSAVALEPTGRFRLARRFDAATDLETRIEQQQRRTT